MKNLIFSIGAVILVTALFSSCSPKVVGQWQVSTYEMNFKDKLDVSLHDVGTIKFKRDGSGEQKFEYTLFGSKVEFTSSFNWYLDKNIVVIESENPLLNDNWKIVKKKLKYQKWESEDRSDKVMELKK